MIFSVSTSRAVLDLMDCTQPLRRALWEPTVSSEPAVSPLGAKILVLMARGLKAQAIADQLHIGEQAIEDELSDMLCSLGLHSRVELILFTYSGKERRAA